MFQDASRLLRTDWSGIGLDPIRGQNPATVEIPQLVKVAESIGKAIDMLAEEVANLARAEQPLTHNAKLTLETTQKPGSEDASLIVRNFAPYDDGYAAKFYGRVLFDPPLNPGGGGAAVLGWARAVSDWVYDVDNDSYVDCKITTSRTDATSDLGNIRVYLPRTAYRDPNVRSGEIIGYLLDDNDEATCITDYLDDMLTVVKGWMDPDNIPPGWELVYEGLMIFGYKEGDPLFGTPGDTGGGIQHTHNNHDASVIDDHTDLETELDGNITLTPSGTTGNDDPLVNGTVNPAHSDLGGDGEWATSPQDAQPTIVPPEEHVISEEVAVSDPGHGHEVDLDGVGIVAGPTINAVVDVADNFTGMLFKGLYRDGSEIDSFSTEGFHVAIWKPDIFEDVTLTGDHVHWVDAGELAGLLTISDHYHTLSMNHHTHPISGSGFVAEHQHTIDDLEHTGTLVHDFAYHLPPYVVVCWIKRTS